MAEKKTSNAEELKKDKAQKDESKSKAQKADKKKSKKKNPFKSIGKFFKGVNAERKKVVWPTAKETIRNSIIVLVVVAIVGVAIYAVDTLLSLGVKGIKSLKDETTISETVSEDTTDELQETETAESTTQAAE